MTTNTDIVNRALQKLGTRTTVTDGELAAQSTNEAIQATLILAPFRDRLLRMAPWDCAKKTANLIWLTSVPGTPENTSPATQNWQPGQPAPPWAYEYWYPDDCLRACFVIPGNQTGQASAIPITTAVTGNPASFWSGQPIRFKVAVDQFRAGSGLIIVSAGSGYQVGDKIILGTDTLNQNYNAGAVPAGIVRINVDTVNGAGAITGASLTNFTTVQQNALLFGVPTYNLVQVETTGLGSGAVASVSGVGQTSFENRVILTNQEFATLTYVKQVTDPNVMDPAFVEAWVCILASGLQNALRDDKALANNLISEANIIIAEARKADGNEGLTVNDVTPDFIRIRGLNYTEGYIGPYSNFDWGGFWPVY